MVFFSSAIENGHDGITEYLIKKGANIEVENSKQETPLFTGSFTFFFKKHFYMVLC